MHWKYLSDAMLQERHRDAERTRRAVEAYGENRLRGCTFVLISVTMGHPWLYCSWTN
jgi:hypothetical protein